MNSLISKVIEEAAACYQSGDTSVSVSARPGPPGPTITNDVVIAEQPATPSVDVPSGADDQKTRRAPKPHLEVGLGFNSESNLYAGFTEEPVGVFVATHTRLAVGTVVDLDVALPDGRTFTTTGRVQWVQEPRDANDADTVPGLGVEFTHVKERMSWKPPRPEVVTPSMPPISVMSIHPLKREDAGAVREFGKAREPHFYED
jgi:Tfp pilus assembly protein PilZ